MQGTPRLHHMSDSTDYLMAHARSTLMEARKLPPGPTRIKLRHIGGVYHLLKQGAYSNLSFIDDYRLARKSEDQLRNNPHLYLVSGPQPPQFTSKRKSPFRSLPAPFLVEAKPMIAAAQRCVRLFAALASDQPPLLGGRRKDSRYHREP